MCGNERIGKKMKENPIGWRGSDWVKAAERSKNFDDFKCYIIRIFNDEENFYKIGKSFTTVKYRFKCQECNSLMPYKYEVLKIIVGETAKEISNLERKLHNLHKKYQYIPKKGFAGMYECFSKIITV